MKNRNIGYWTKTNTSITEHNCVLTIGSIIIFNGRKKLVTHTDGSRNYTNIKGKTVDITISSSGFLKDIETGEETRSNWYNVTADSILHFEHLELVNL
jgi:hypothetical protein